MAALLVLGLVVSCSKKDAEKEGAESGKEVKTPSADKKASEAKPPATTQAASGGAEASQNEFKTWADEMCACKDPACLNQKIAGFKPLYQKYNGMTGEAARKVGEEAGKEAGRGVNCFIQGGGDKALMEEIAKMMR